MEDDVTIALNQASEGTPFEGTIEKISGQRFPDIIAAKCYGVEVKSSKDEKWITLGGSINESTRIQGIERIFLIFGKLAGPVEFCSRLYEDCLSDIVVTHYPRYKIDMNLPAGETIFDKMDITYDELRLSDEPVSRIVNYYKSQLGEGESLWWTGKPIQEGHIEVPMKIRLWKTLTIAEKHNLKIKAFSYFPNLLSNSSSKYERFSLWLAATHGIISTCVRDSFSAGGQGTIKTSKSFFNKIPRSLINIYENKDAIVSNILDADRDFLCETWQAVKINDDRIGQWIDIVAKICSLPNYKTVEVLNAIFNRE